MTIQIELLEETDVLLPTDFVRYAEIQYQGQSDYVCTQSCYGGSPINFFKWLNVVDAGILHWIGKPLSEYLNAMSNLVNQPIAKEEFARGNIPKEHQYSPDKEMLKVFELHRKLYKTK